MKKFDDFFAAGVVLGVISDLPFIPFWLCVGWIAPQIVPPWSNLAMLFFKPPELYSFGAQFFGFLMNLGVAALNGILVGGVLRFTGRDFAYLKSVCLCLALLVVMFAGINPLLLGKSIHPNLGLTYLAFAMTLIFAVILAYLFKRFTNIGLHGKIR